MYFLLEKRETSKSGTTGGDRELGRSHPFGTGKEMGKEAESCLFGCGCVLDAPTLVLKLPVNATLRYYQGR